MKKPLFALALIALLSFFGNTASAQGTIVANLQVINNTNCPVNVMGMGMDNTCNVACNTGMSTLAGNSQVSIPFWCIYHDAVTSFAVGVRDIGSGQAVRVGNGCGLTTSTTYVDCQGITRTVLFFPPNLVTIN